MGRKGQSITLSISEREKAELEALATEFGMTWGEKPNISKLLQAIARHHLLIAPNHDWQELRLQALKKALDALSDLGQMPTALEIAHLLLERSELSIPLRREVERFVSQPPSAWRIELDRYILQRQPFRLTYQDAADRIWQFHIQYALITLHEERQYLDCWCEETEGNLDVPELQHNWSLRLDRIPSETAIAPLQGKWRNNLDTITVEFHLLKGLAFAYRSKTGGDVTEEFLGENPPPVPPWGNHQDRTGLPVRRVIRKVTSTFWFFREILRYGEDCLLVSPEDIRTRFKDKLQRLGELYDL